MADAFEVLLFSRLYQHLMGEKNEALNKSGEDFDCHMNLLQAEKLELVLWEQNILEISEPLIELSITDTIFTDDSSIGWGAFSHFGKINGRWADEEIGLHVNNLELLAIFIAFSYSRRNSWANTLEL